MDRHEELSKLAEVKQSLSLELLERQSRVRTLEANLTDVQRLLEMKEAILARAYR